MDFYVIPPVHNAELMTLGERVFVLAQLYKKNESYRKMVHFLKAQGKWITLDNGAGDHDLVTMEDLLDITVELMPNEVIPPDVLFNKEVTMSNLGEFIIRLEDRLEETIQEAGIEIFAVPQGSTIEEWLQCYSEMLDIEDVTTLGLSKITVPKLFHEASDDQGIMEGRHKCFDALSEMDMIKKPIHLLGAGDPREFIYYRDQPLIRSTDSCFSILAGMNAIDWNQGDFTRLTTPRNYFEQEIDPINMSVVLGNISFLRDIVKGDS